MHLTIRNFLRNNLIGIIFSICDGEKTGENSAMRAITPRMC